jgi:nicotinamidase-related amidase
MSTDAGSSVLHLMSIESSLTRRTTQRKHQNATFHQTLSFQHPRTSTFTTAAFTPFDKTHIEAPGHYRPQQTALLLLDYSHIITNNGGGRAHSAVKVATNMRNWAKTHAIEVIHALIDFSGATPPLPTHKEPIRLRNLIAHVKIFGGGDEPAELLEGVIADKTFYRRLGNISAIHSANIKEYLQDNGIRSLIIMGLSTSGCVLRTSFEAAEDGFVVTVIEDGCADPDRDVHDFLFGKVLQRTVFVMTAAEFQEGYEGTL